MLSWDSAKLNIFYNEAVRQEAIDTYNQAIAFHAPETVTDKVVSMLKVHGAYTEGFYEEEWQGLQNALASKAGK